MTTDNHDAHETPTGPTADSATPAREETEDHDLLTYGEAGVRVFLEVEAQKARVAELDAANGDHDTLQQARARLSDLLEAQERNRRQPINDDNFEQFFGYKGTTKRNT